VVLGLNIGAPLYIDAIVPPQLRSTAQALLGTVAVGVGGAGSSLLAGSLLDHGGASAPYWFGGAGALALLLALPRHLPRIDREAHASG
jgi:MFS family permease